MAKQRRSWTSGENQRRHLIRCHAGFTLQESNNISNEPHDVTDRSRDEVDPYSQRYVGSHSCGRPILRSRVGKVYIGGSCRDNTG